MIRLLTVALLWIAAHVPHLHVTHGRGTIYGPRVDGRWHKPTFACDFAPRRAGRSEIARRLFVDGMVLASRSLACWTIVEVCSASSGLCSPAVVADFGPRRAMVDLLDPLAERLQHDGGEVLVVVADRGVHQVANGLDMRPPRWLGHLDGGACAVEGER
jgi:hypothetical protein